MLSVKGMIRDGLVQPAEPLHGLDGRQVIITVLDEAETGAAPAAPPGTLMDESGVETAEYDPEKDTLMQLIKRCQVDTGIGDLAHQHDHYLYGTPKKP